MNIKGEWKEPCNECGALDGCCETAKARSETAVSLARLVARQSATITTLQRELYDARQVIGDLREKMPRECVLGSCPHPIHSQAAS